jgi:hypothetical protein
MPANTILILDRDIGFVFSLGRMLDNAGYAALPARNVADAAALMEQVSLEIDLLVLDPSLEGAVAFARKVLDTQGRLKTIATMAGHGDSYAAFPEADARLAKPEAWDEAARAEWVSTIQQLFGSEQDSDASSGAG